MSNQFIRNKSHKTKLPDGEYNFEITSFVFNSDKKRIVVKGISQDAQLNASFDPLLENYTPLWYLFEAVGVEFEEDEDISVEYLAKQLVGKSVNIEVKNEVAKGRAHCNIKKFYPYSPLE